MKKSRRKKPTFLLYNILEYILTLGDIMKRLITDIAKITGPSEPFTFLKDTGIPQEKKDEAAEIINNLKKVIETKKLTALSAPQIGINKRIFCIKFDDQIKTFINPIVTKKSRVVILPETFASMPGKEILIARPEEVTVIYYTEEFKYEDNKLMGAAAQLFDQQCQVLDGIMPAELGMVSDVEQDGSLSDLSDEERIELVEYYKKEFIPTKLKAVKDTITEEESSEYKKLKFTEDVINGRAQIAETPPEIRGNRAQRRKTKKILNEINKMKKRGK